MTSSSILSMVVTQTWQVAMLASCVWFITRFATRDRAHISHMLWALVLLKCVTPPIWSSPVGLFTQLRTRCYFSEAFELRKELFFLRVVHRTTIATPCEISNCVTKLNSQLGLQQRVGVKVVSSSFGPSVYGLLRPMVWLASRRVTIESERCCDGVAILPGARYLKAEPTEVKRSSEKETKATKTIGELRLAPPVPNPAVEAPFFPRKGDVRIEMQLLEIPSTFDSTRVLDNWMLDSSNNASAEYARSFAPSRLVRLEQTFRWLDQCGPTIR